MNLRPIQRATMLAITLTILGTIAMIPEGPSATIYWLLGALIGSISGILIGDENNNQRRWFSVGVAIVIYIALLIASSAGTVDGHSTFYPLMVKLNQALLVYFFTTFALAYR